ncbi:TULIP family P47-like protein [Kitasatospora paranensis]|uniref:TULIP family P47-like protein n=1 Tax=Kitasatospora paranensis TaxID=258053 RepID=A0ABW2G339_9ACTN
MNIHGWDTVTAVSVAAVNRALAADRPGLVAEFTATGTALGGSYAMRGTFGDWQVVGGGSGDLLRISVPITAGTVRTNGGTAIDLAGTRAVLEVSLDLLPAADGTVQNLVFALHGAARPGDTPKPGVVTPIRLTAPAAVTAHLGELGADSVLAGVAQALAADAASVSHVLASVNLVPPGAGGWPSPTHSTYAYQELPDGAGYLSVLSTTGGRDATGLPAVVDPELFAAGGDTAFAISQDLFLVHVLTPVLPRLFDGADATCFDWDPATHEVTAARTFAIAPVRSGALDYVPLVESVSVTVSGGLIDLTARGTCDLGARISMDFRFSSRHPVTARPGSEEIGFAADPNPLSEHAAHIPWWAWLISPIGAGVAAAAASAVADGIADQLGSRFGTVGLHALPPLPVRSPGMRAVTVTSVRLDSALMISGTAA